MRRATTLIVLFVLVPLMLSAELMAQRGGRGGGGRGGGGGGRGGGGGNGGNSRPNNPGQPPSPGDNGDKDTPASNPERDQRRQIQWVLCNAKEASTDGITESDLLMRVLDAKGRSGMPTLLLISDASEAAAVVEEGLFKDERITLASLFCMPVKLPVLAPMTAEMGKKLTGGKGAAVFVFDGEKKEVKRFLGSAATPSAVFAALTAPVKKSFDVNLPAFVSQEQKYLAELDKAYTKYEHLDSEKQDLQNAAASNSSARKKFEEITQEMQQLNEQINAIREKEKAHIATAPKR